MNLRIKAGNRVRTFGGWYRHDLVFADGVELIGFIQVRRRNGRTESTTHYQHTSSAVLGTDMEWLYCQNKANEQELLTKGLLSAAIPN
jgi:hypothetical protein